MAISYIVAGVGQCQVLCLAADTKPPNPGADWTLIEKDTGKTFRVVASAWTENINTTYAQASAAVLTNDSRLSDARTPTSHAHAPADITGTAVVTADARLSDARAPTAHVHAAGDVTSGQLAMARIASGAPDGTKFVRDDGTLATPTAAAADTNPDVFITTADYSLLANRSLVLAGEYEIGSGFVTDIASDAILEV